MWSSVAVWPRRRRTSAASSRDRDCAGGRRLVLAGASEREEDRRTPKNHRERPHAKQGSNRPAVACENHIGAIEMGKMTTALPIYTNDVDLFPGMVKKWGLSFLINTAKTPEGR